MKRRRANVLFVLALTTVCTLFLAATTQAQAMVWVAVVAVVCLLGYVCLLGQLRQRDLQRELRVSHVAAEPERRPRPVREAPPIERELATRAAPSHDAAAAARLAHRPGASTEHRPSALGRSLVGRRLIPSPPLHSLPPRGCSSVGRAQQSHC